MTIKKVFLDNLAQGVCEFDNNKILLENDFVQIDFFDSISDIKSALEAES